MLPNPPGVDRRAALKNRHRRAIVDAAAALMDERKGTDFTVDELAERADVSRRTIFNHFASIDAIVTEVCSDVLGTVVESLTSARAGSEGENVPMFEELTEALRSTDLIAPMVYLTRVLGNQEPRSSPRQAHMLVRAFSDVSDRLSAEMLRRHPSADELTVHLLVGSLTSGLVVLHHHWVVLTGAADDQASRGVWAELLERLVETVRIGHGADASAHHTA